MAAEQLQRGLDLAEKGLDLGALVQAGIGRESSPQLLFLIQ